MPAYIEILRPLNGAIAIFACLSAALVSGVYDPAMIALAAMVVFLSSGAGMVANDYFDYNIDKVNRPNRPLPSGRISLKEARLYSAALFSAAIALCIFLNAYMLMLAAFNVLVSFIYSWKLKRSVSGNWAVSWLSASVFLFGGLLAGSVSAVILLMLIISFSASMGRELTKAIEDMPGDKKAGARTLPLMIGPHFSGWLALLFIFFAILFSFLPYAFGMLGMYYLLIVIIADIVWVYSCFLIFPRTGRAQQFMKLGMLLAVIAFIAGVL